MDKLYPVFTLNNECHDCYKCVRHCYVKAIRIEKGHASVIPENCIACGRCIQVCPQNAKKVRNDISRAKSLIATNKQVYISIAPSWPGVFKVNASKMIGALKALGAKGVSETALGAEEVSIEVANYMKSSDKKLHISTACPAIVDFVRLYLPEYTDYLTPIASPALTHARMLKDQFGEDISVVFAGPCIAKKNEAQKHPDLIDVALTFEELIQWLNEEGISLESFETNKEEYVLDKAHEGFYYPIEGGMIETIKLGGTPEDTQLIGISSLDTFKEALQGLNANTLKKKTFIEALACDGGCVNGPCISSKKPGISIVSDVLANVELREAIPDKATVVVKEAFEARPAENAEYTLEEIQKAMASIGKYSIEDELNCGGCGYDNCRQLAIALMNQKAESSMCISYMRKIAMKKAGAMLRCMPSGIVMVDKHLKVMETNESFVNMFIPELYDLYTSTAHGIAGASIEKLLPCGNLFKRALSSGKDINKEHYSIDNKFYDISVFTIEPDQLVGAMFTDVTKTEIKREQIANKAQEVINKNISTVQNIACLLGEHVVDIELLLSSITESYELKEASGDE